MEGDIFVLCQAGNVWIEYTIYTAHTQISYYDTYALFQKWMSQLLVSGHGFLVFWSHKYIFLRSSPGCNLFSVSVLCSSLCLNLNFVGYMAESCR